MPHLSGQIGPWGPLIFVHVGVSVPRAVALGAAGQLAPQPVVAKLVVDTGASLTAIDSTILAQLGLTSKGKVPVHTPSTQGVPHQADQYDVSLTIFGQPNMPAVYVTNAIAVLDGKFKAQGIDGLLGRDVLAVARLTYGGPDAWYGISF